MNYKLLASAVGVGRDRTAGPGGGEVGEFPTRRQKPVEATAVMEDGLQTTEAAAKAG